MPQKWNRGPFYRRPIFMRGKLRTDILNHGSREESPDLQRSQLFSLVSTPQLYLPAPCSPLFILHTLTLSRESGVFVGIW